MRGVQAEEEAVDSRRLEVLSMSEQPAGGIRPGTLEHVSIRTGSCRILHSGTATSFGRQPLDLSLQFGPDDTILIAGQEASNRPRLKLVVSFGVDEGDSTPRIVYMIRAVKAGPGGGITLEMCLVNFDSPLGSGTPEPALLGAVNGLPFFVHLRVYPLADGDPTLHFSFFIEDGQLRSFAPFA